jgi:hypothetical protein
VAEDEIECIECGTRARFSRMTFTRSADPDEAALEQYRQQRARSLARSLEVFASASFAPHGLDEAWTGKRWIGGHGLSDNVVTMLELAHGDDPFDEGEPQVRVETRTDEVLHVSPRTLLQKLWHREGQIDEGLRDAAFRQKDDAAFDRACDHVDIAVDGTPVRFQVVSAGESWLAHAIVGDQLLSIDARHWPIERTRIVTVDDITPYERRDW